MEVRIGVQNVTRELVLESSQSADDVATAVADAVAGDQVLRLHDDRGRLVIVPTQTLAYVDIGVEESRRVGFGAI